MRPFKLNPLSNVWDNVLPPMLRIKPLVSVLEQVFSSFISFASSSPFAPIFPFYNNGFNAPFSPGLGLPNKPNARPLLAVDDVLTLQEDSVRTIGWRDLFGQDGLSGALNDQAPLVSGLALQISRLPIDGVIKLAGQPVTLNQNIAISAIESGQLSYHAPAHFNGVSSFAYRLYDGQRYSNVAQVQLTVAAVNDAPQAVDDVLVLTNQQAKIIYSRDLLGADGVGSVNDSDVDHQQFQFILVRSLPTQGELRLKGQLLKVNQQIAISELEAGQFSYHPAAHASTKQVSFDYVVSDGLAESNVATVRIQLNAPLSATIHTQVEVNVQPTADDRAPVLSKVGKAGDYVLAWLGKDSAGTARVWLQKFNAQGQALTEQLAVDLPAASLTDRHELRVTSLDENGAFAVSWLYREQTTLPYSLALQTFNAAGVPAPKSASFDAQQYNLDNPYIPLVLADGRFLLALSQKNADGVQQKLVQLYQVDGARMGAPLLLGTGQIEVVWAKQDTVTGALNFVLNDRTKKTLELKQFNADGGLLASKVLSSENVPGFYSTAQTLNAQGDFVVSLKDQDHQVFVQTHAADGRLIKLFKLEAATFTNFVRFGAVGEQGDFVVWWHKTGRQQSVSLQKFNINGQALTEPVVIKAEAAEMRAMGSSEMYSPYQATALVKLGDQGDFALLGKLEYLLPNPDDQASVPRYSWIQLFNASGQTKGKRIVLHGIEPTISSDVNGSFVVSYVAADAGGDLSLRVEHFSIDGKSLSGPQAFNDLLITYEDESYLVKTRDFLASDLTGRINDFSEKPLTQLKIEQLPQHAVLLLDGQPVTAGQILDLTVLDQGKLRLVATTNFNGQTHFLYRVGDGEQFSNVARVDVEVRAVNDAPVAQNDIVHGVEDTALTLGVALLNNDQDVDGSVTGFTVSTLPTQGRLLFENELLATGRLVTRSDLEQGKLRFEPAPNFYGEVEFQYHPYDGQQGGNPATVKMVFSNTPEALLSLSPQGVSNLGSGDSKILTVGPNGEFVVLWQLFEAADKTALWLQKFDVTGKPLTSLSKVIQPNSLTKGQMDVQLFKVGSQGEFALSWLALENLADPPVTGLYLQSFDASGNPRGTQPVLLDAHAAYWRNISPLMLSDDLVGAWYHYQDGKSSFRVQQIDLESYWKVANISTEIELKDGELATTLARLPDEKVVLAHLRDNKLMTQTWSRHYGLLSEQSRQITLKAPAYKMESVVLGEQGKVMLATYHYGQVNLYRLDSDGLKHCRALEAPGVFLNSATPLQLINVPNSEQFYLIKSHLSNGNDKVTVQIQRFNADGSDAGPLTSIDATRVLPEGVAINHKGELAVLTQQQVPGAGWPYGKLQFFGTNGQELGKTIEVSGTTLAVKANADGSFAISYAATHSDNAPNILIEHFEVNGLSHVPLLAFNDELTVVTEHNRTIYAGELFGSDGAGRINDSSREGSALQTIKIESLPSQAVLTLAGKAVSVGQQIAVADIEAGKLSISASNSGDSFFHYRWLNEQTSSNLARVNLKLIKAEALTPQHLIEADQLTQVMDGIYYQEAAQFVWRIQHIPVGTQQDRINNLGTLDTLDLRDLVSHGADLFIDNQNHTLTARFSDQAGEHKQIINVTFESKLQREASLIHLGDGLVYVG